MKYSLIILVSVFLLSNEIIAKHTANRKEYSNLKIILDRSLSFKLLTSVSLTSNGIDLDINWEYDERTRSFNCNWSNLSKGKYDLNIKTVFENSTLLTFNLTGDTSIVISNLYDLIDLSKMNKASFKNADSIRIYFRSAGCFHNYKQKITLRKSDDKNYHLTFCYDTITIEKINGRKMVVKTPVFTYQNVTAVIIDSLFNLVKNSQVQRKKAFETGISCVSTTHENLFILINNSLFQFSDAGLCDWNLYRNFKREFIE